MYRRKLLPDDRVQDKILFFKQSEKICIVHKLNDLYKQYIPVDIDTINNIPPTNITSEFDFYKLINDYLNILRYLKISLPTQGNNLKCQTCVTFFQRHGLQNSCSINNSTPYSKL
jgi:hypothetical protein